MYLLALTRSPEPCYVTRVRNGNTRSQQAPGGHYRSIGRGEILDVAWRPTALKAPSGDIPEPSSRTRRNEIPPPSISTSTREASVKRVLYQLFYRRRWTLYNLSGGYAVRHLRR